MLLLSYFHHGMCHLLFYDCSSSPWRKHRFYLTFHEMKWLLWCRDVKLVHAGANISFRMLSFLAILDTFGYGPELFSIRLGIFLNTVWYFLILFGYRWLFHFGYASFFWYSAFLDIFGYYYCLACAWRFKDPQKSQRQFLDILGNYLLCKFQIVDHLFLEGKGIENLENVCAKIVIVHLKEIKRMIERGLEIYRV